MSSSTSIIIIISSINLVSITCIIFIGIIMCIVCLVVLVSLLQNCCIAIISKFICGMIIGIIIISTFLIISVTTKSIIFLTSVMSMIVIYFSHYSFNGFFRFW